MQDPGAGRRHPAPDLPATGTLLGSRRCRLGLVGCRLDRRRPPSRCRGPPGACRPSDSTMDPLRAAATRPSAGTPGLRRTPVVYGPATVPLRHWRRGPLAKLTGERPLEGITPDSLLALHAAGYSAVRERLGPGRMLDVGCGQGFETAQFAGTDRTVMGVDYCFEAARDATTRYGPAGLRVAQCDARRLSLGHGHLRLGLLLPPHRALPRRRGPRRRAGPGPLARGQGLRHHPQRPGRLREPLPHPSLPPVRVGARFSSAPSTTSGWAASTPSPT